MEQLNLNTYIPEHARRKKVYTYIHELLVKYNKIYKYNYSDYDLQKKALNIEKGLFNYAIKDYYNSDIPVSKFWSQSFEIIYKNRSCIIYSNLNPESHIKNIDLLKRFFNNEFTEAELTHFNSQKLFPTRYDELTKLYNLDKRDDTEKIIEDGFFKCKKCSTMKTTYYQLQTRSAKIIGWKSTLPITSWLCYWKNSCSPSYLILKC